MNRLVWLLASLALAIAPHLAHLPVWVGPLCVGLGIWRVAVERGITPWPRKALVVALTLGCTAGILFEYRTLLGRDAGVTLLVTMIALKLMEMRTPRDTLVTVFLAYFLVSAGFLYSQSIPMALYLLGVVWLTTTTMIGYHDPNGGLAARLRLKLAGTLLLQAVPLMLVLFVLFPRIPPIWALPEDAHAGLTGLSDSMRPGEISQLIQSSEVAFRVQFDRAPPPASARYWRGPVLWDYDGQTWSARTPAAGTAPPVQPRGEPVRYLLTLEPHNQRWLFALDLPAAAPADSRIQADMQMLANAPVRQRMRYRLTSYPDSRLDDPLDAATRQRALALPARANPRTRTLAERWRAEEADGARIVERALRLFREQSFFYTLNPPRLGAHAMDDFLFGSRRGFCEHYASAFVTLMRAAGLPARVVTGYQGGAPNPLGDYWIVRQSDAHAWSEVWLDGRGWVRVDPTAAVSPDRVEQGIAAALPAAELPLALSRLDLGWLQAARMRWDLVNNRWNQWVLGYGQEGQRSLLAGLHPWLARWEGMITALASGIVLLLAGLAAWSLRHGLRRDRDPALAAYRRFCTRLARRGLARAAHEGPQDYAARVLRARPDLAPAVMAITRDYIDLRYGRTPGQLARLRRAVRVFRP